LSYRPLIGDNVSLEGCGQATEEGDSHYTQDSQSDDHLNKAYAFRIACESFRGACSERDSSVTEFTLSEILQSRSLF